jgi:hypothetical protein
VRVPAVVLASAVPEGGRVAPGGRPTTKDLFPTPARDPGDGRSPAPGLCAQTVFAASVGSLLGESVRLLAAKPAGGVGAGSVMTPRPQGG